MLIIIKTKLGLNMSMEKSFNEKTRDSLITLKKSKKIISEILDKNGDDESLGVLVRKITAIEDLIKDAYKTTIEGKNKSNKEAKQNFVILFEMSDKIGEASIELKNVFEKEEAKR